MLDPVCASTALMQVASMISIRDGTRPARIAADTAAPALSVSANAATIVQGANGLGRSAKVASVMMPRVPSEPTINLVRS